MKYIETVKEIRQYRNKRRVIKRFFPSLFFSYWISPYVSAFFVKKNVTPNKITLLMLPVSVFASVFFACNLTVCKIIGILFFHVWFMIDACDGQVARYTNNFSKYGGELDYLAHQFCHIFFIASICFNMYWLHYDLSFLNLSIDYTTFIILCFAIMIFIEYSFRNMCSIETAMSTRSTKLEIGNKSNNDDSNTDEESISRVYSKYPRLVKQIGKRIIELTIILWNSFNCLDNFILFATPFVIIDYYLGSYSFIILTILFVLLSFFHLSAMYCRLVRRAANE